MGKGTTGSRVKASQPLQARSLETHLDYNIGRAVIITHGKFQGRQGVIAGCQEEEGAYGDYAITATDGGVEIDDTVSSRDFVPFGEDTVREIIGEDALKSAYQKLKQMRDIVVELEPRDGRPSGRSNQVKLTLEELRALVSLIEAGN